jgi:hypothetical protein
MNIKTVKTNNVEIAVISSDDICISDGQSALDFMMSVNYETGCRSIAINKEAIAEDFFILSTRVAGDVLQKFINYHFRLAIIGDFYGYKSKALNDFIFESNNGRDIFFVACESDAINKLVSIIS